MDNIYQPQNTHYIYIFSLYLQASLSKDFLLSTTNFITPKNSKTRIKNDYMQIMVRHHVPHHIHQAARSTMTLPILEQRMMGGFRVYLVSTMKYCNLMGFLKFHQLTTSQDITFCNTNPLPFRRHYNSSKKLH